jgi:flagella basal body P-ring formation protein FlgA
MSTTMTPGRVSGNGSKPHSAGIVAAKRRQRSLPLAGVAVACMLAAIVAFVGIQLASTDRQPMLAVARPVQAGATITADDLTVAQVAEDPALKPIPLSSKSSVVGQTAAEDLAPGALLTQASLGGASTLNDGEALVGVEVPPAAAPVDALSAGDRVQVIAVDKSDDGKATGLGQVLAEGRVVRVSPSATSGSTGTSVSVAVPADKAPAVAGASVAQRAALVVIR